LRASATAFLQPQKAELGFPPGTTREAELLRSPLRHRVATLLKLNFDFKFNFDCFRSALRLLFCHPAVFL
jgi:hypothetical protein